MKKGRALEILVASIEKSLNDDENVTIESPKKIRSKINNNLREFDVVVSLKYSHHEIQIAIECKDRKAPVGDPEIEGFVQKCQVVGINKGMFVSTSGYTETALQSAKFYGIKCVSIDEINNTDWLAEDAKFVVHTKRFLLAKYKSMIKSSPDEGFNDFTIHIANDQEITDEGIKNYLVTIMDTFPCQELNNEITHQVQIRFDGAYIKCKKSGKKWSITGVLADVTYVCEVEESGFNTQSYKDNSDDQSLAEIASAEIKLDGKQKKFTLINSDDGISVKLIDGE